MFKTYLEGIEKVFAWLCEKQEGERVFKITSG